MAKASSGAARYHRGRLHRDPAKATAQGTGRLPPFPRFRIGSFDSRRTGAAPTLRGSPRRLAVPTFSHEVNPTKSVLARRTMVDRVYKASLPAFKKSLKRLRGDFSGVGSGTDWTKLRIDPLIRHVEVLERILESREFARESSRLTQGVGFFHSDLEYLRKNIQGLEKILDSKKPLGRRGNKR